MRFRTARCLRTPEVERLKMEMERREAASANYMVKLKQAQQKQVEELLAHIEREKTQYTALLDTMNRSAEARIFRTTSYGAVVSTMSRASSSSTRLVDFLWAALSFIEILTPSSLSKCAMDEISARCGRFTRCRVSSVNKHAAINGSPAFLAPLMGISPNRGFPPMIRTRSILFS